MKKFYAIFAAMLISICSFASKDIVPSDEVLADHYDRGQVCVCFFVPADMACNDIVLTGSFNGWKGWADECVAVEPVKGYDGWYVAAFDPEGEPDAVKGIQAKPVMLDVDGNFNWEYQIGAATAIRGGVQVVQGAYAGEIDLLNYGTDAPNVFTVDAWKRNPCTAIYHNYTITVISKGCDGYVVPFVIGAMNGWTFTQMQRDYAKTDENNGYPTFTYSFKAAEGTPFQILSGLMDDEGYISIQPSWSDEAYLQALVDGEWVRIPGEDGDNLLTGFGANITVDMRNDYLRWARCKPEENAEYVVLAVNLPTLHAPAAVDVIGSFDGWAGTSMKLLQTGWWFVELEAKASDCFKFRSAGTWDHELEIYDAENDEWRFVADNQFVFSQLWSDDTWKGVACKFIELDLSDPEYFRWSGDFAPVEYNVNLSGFTWGYISNWGTIYNNWSGTLPANTTIQIECYPNCGTFEGWSDGVTSSYRSFTLTQDTTISAIISGIETYQVSITAGAHGYLSSGYVGERTSCDGSLYVEAYAYDGYRFTHWSDGVTDNPRNIYFSQDTTIVAIFAEYIKHVKIGDLYYDLNIDDKTATVVGTQSGSGTSQVSVTDNSIAEWDNLPSEYVAAATCPEDAALLGLKSVKVYADPTYINILVEPNMEEVPDLEWVPFHVYLDADNSNSTGGSGDLFSDANTDILCEGAVFCEGQPYSYNPAVFKWWGEVGGDGWYWTDPSVEHDASDFWGAIIGEGQLPVGASQYVDGKFEIQLLRELLATVHPLNDTEFGIGVEILQNWSAVGVLPIGSDTEENPGGKAAKLKVKINRNGTVGETSELNPNLVIPSSVTYNGEKYTVTTIENRAFANHTELTSVEIPTTMTNIAYDAFEDCYNITSVVWKAKNCNTYNFGNQVESFVFGNEVESIPYELCYRMYKLTSITIPSSVTYIGSRAFMYCEGLTSIEIPNSVIDCGYDVFYNCYNLISYTGPASLCTGMYYLQKVILTGGTIDFSYGGVAYNGNLTYLDIEACDNTVIPSHVFSGNINLKQLILPKHLESIEYMAIAECMNLEQITLPATVKTIGNRAFEACRSLKSVTFAGSALTTIGDWAFYNCHELRNLDIPEGVTNIGKAAFYGCAYLSEVTLPASMQALGDNAFALCSMMQKLTVNAVVPPTIEDKTFEQVSTDMPVYVPEVSVPAYKADQYWGRMNIIGAETAVENINSDAAAIRKQMIDGKLFIIRDGKTYSVQGQELR